MSKLSSRAMIFLQTITESSMLMDNLEALLHELEEKVDPDEIEIHLVHNMYEFLEKYRILEHNLRSYSKSGLKTTGSKLSQLYENKSKHGTSILFE